MSQVNDRTADAAAEATSLGSAEGIVYLDNAATSFPKAPGVGEAMSRFALSAAANPGRSGHRMAVAAERMLDDLRHVLTRMLGGDDPSRLVFALNTTDALNMAIKGVLDGDGDGGVAHVVTTVLEHNSVSRPLQALADAGRIELTRVDSDDAGVVPAEAVASALRAETKLVVMAHASNVTGAIHDVGAVGKAVRAQGGLFLVDAAQTAGVLPIDMKAMSIDLLAFPGHKGLLGPTGTGGLYVGSRVDSVRPWREGGTGGDSTTPTQPREWPHVLEGGTPNTIGLAGLAAAAAYVEPRVEAMREHERQLVARLLDRLGGDERITLHGPADAAQRVGAVSINVAGYEPSDVATILDDSFGIAVRSGLHCAPGAHRRLGTFESGSVRISPGPFSTEADVDAVLDAIDQIAG